MYGRKRCALTASYQLSLFAVYSLRSSPLGQCETNGLTQTAIFHFAGGEGDGRDEREVATASNLIKGHENYWCSECALACCLDEAVSLASCLNESLSLL